MDTKEHLIQELDRSRETMRGILAQIDTKRQIYPSWTIKEILAHLAGWDDATTASLRAHASNQEPAVPAAQGIDYYNAESVATRQTLDLEHIIKEWELAREQLKAALRALPPEKMEESVLSAWGRVVPVDKLVLVFVEHELEHAEEIRQLLAQEPA